MVATVTFRKKNIFTPSAAFWVMQPLPESDRSGPSGYGARLGCGGESDKPRAWLRKGKSAGFDDYFLV